MLIPHVDVGRRAFLGLTAALLTAGPLARPADAISATTMTGKTRPDLSLILADAARAEGGTVVADLVVSGGSVATVAFDSKWKLAEGGYYDVEANSREGDAAYLQRVKLPPGKDLTTLPAKFFSSAVLQAEGRYGAYGAPVDAKVLGDVNAGGRRNVDISFSALSPGSAESQRKAVVSAVQPPGSSDLILLVVSTSTVRWKKSGGEEAARATAR